MTFDPTKPVQTRGGLKARIICTDRVSSGDLWPILALIGWNKTEEVVQSYRKDGTSGSSKEADYDLINVPVKTSTWQNVYANAQSGSRDTYPTKEGADAMRALGRVGYIRRDYEDGVFVGAEFEPI